MDGSFRSWPPEPGAGASLAGPVRLVSLTLSGRSTSDHRVLGRESGASSRLQTLWSPPLSAFLATSTAHLSFRSWRQPAPGAGGRGLQAPEANGFCI